MASRENQFGQPIGDEVPEWRAADKPPREPMSGRFCRLEPLDRDVHVEDLYEAFSEDGEGRLWTYMSSGPFESIDQFTAWMDAACATEDPLFHGIIDLATGKAVGVCAYLRIQQDVGVIEVGSITYSPRLQRTPMATEAMFLMMARVFDELGYRRYEWKCDSLNAASRDAAVRLGFSYDGLFEQAIVYKGRNRDTAWYSILDRDWPALKRAYADWLDPHNFDERGKQKRKLQDFIAGTRI
jgi:RimJ/RimL family protein N-acetyltransferase